MFPAKQLRRNARRHVAAVTAAAASIGLLQQANSNQKKKRDQSWDEEETVRCEGSSPQYRRAFTSPTSRSLLGPWIVLSPQQLPTRTHCEGSMISSPSSSTSFLPRIRRHSTVEALEELAQDMDRLEVQYRVDWKRPLGEGTFGAVFSAVDRHTHETVAVKQIRKHLTDSASFQREIDALMILQQAGGHPNICGMRATFENKDNFYIVLDLIDGPEVFDQLISKGAYSEADAAWHIREVASALCWMHSLGLVHADLKPENLMLSSPNESDGVIKLVDFGCTVQVQCNPADGTVIPPSLKGTTTTSSTRARSTHTPAYSPPEVLLQMRKDKTQQPIIEPSFDAWSLGVILYTMLVGIHPFDPECKLSDQEMEERIVSGEKPPIRGSPYTKHLSEDALVLMEGLMECNPQERLTMDQLLKNRWVMGETASSTKIAGSDQRLAVYRRYQTKIGSTFFKALLSQTDSTNAKNATERVSLLESAFRRLDTDHQGVLKASSIGGETEDAFSYADITSLLSENMKHRYFDKGSNIYSVGEKGNVLYLIDSGTVEFTTADGFHKMLGSGEVVGEELMKDANAQYSGTAHCVTPVHALAISRELFEKYVASDEETLLSMAERYRYRRRERASMVLRMHQKKCKSLSYRKNDTIFRAGDKGKHLYMVEDGEVDISVRGQSVRKLKPNELTGEHAAFFGKPYNVTARCMSDSCKVHAMDSEVMHSLFGVDPSLRQDFRELLLRRDFKKALCAAISKPFPTNETEIRAAFESIDREHAGAISFEGLRSLIQRFDPTYHEADIHDMFHSLDLNDSGDLTWKEFHRIFAMDMES